MQFTGDEHGTAVIRPHPGDGFAWVAPRQAYCDRGHWDWGYQGLPRLPGEPSYYFMELATALEEVAAWLAQSPPWGTLVPGAALLEVNPGALADASGHAPTWSVDEDGQATCQVQGNDETMTLRLRPVAHGFQLELEGVSTIDTADRFPRLYRSASSAMREAGLFAQWRLARIPAQVPSRLDRSFHHEVDLATPPASSRSSPRKPSP